ncbi:MAG TPA: TIGR03936 family radical SAM-associated protein [Acidimicrobiales bacterium]|nr:TIGR03936 family radical SAM-associated protein [Acidimicrobiales bacterium]
MNLRFRFVKLGRVRWTSHRDVARMWERALRRARIPIAYTEGFSPRPKLSFGLALPTGCESLAEYVDVALASPVELAGLQARMTFLLPAGVDVTAVSTVPADSDSLQQDVTSCSWEIEVPTSSPDELRKAVERVLGADSLPLERERKGRREVDDLRPAVLALSTAGTADGRSLLIAELATRPRGVRPVELARLMGLELGLAKRTIQWIERDGSRSEPLAADPAFAAEAKDRAS